MLSCLLGMYIDNYMQPAEFISGRSRKPIGLCAKHTQNILAGGSRGMPPRKIDTLKLGKFINLSSPQLQHIKQGSN